MIRLSLAVLLQLAIGVAGPLPSPTAPPGLEVELRPVGSKTTFYLSETVPLEVVFTSAMASTYSIEIADGWNAAPAADRFLIEPRESVIDRNVWWLKGYACCDSRRAFLTSVPAVYKHELTDFIRFTRPGDYRIQYATRRVFTGPPIRAFTPSEMLVRSNVVTVRIIADDPRWLHDAWPEALAGADVTPVMSELRDLRNLPQRGSLEPPTASDAMVRYRRSTRQLRLLDTPEAIQARVFHLRLPTVDEWRTFEAGGSGYSGVDTSLAYSSRPDLVATALHQRAAGADFGVMRGYFELWANVVLERDHPELVRLTRADGARLPETAGELRKVVQLELLTALRELAQSKTAIAAEITAATIRSVERDLAK
jgi:hypothetical protein